MSAEGKEVIIPENTANLASGIVFIISFGVYGVGYGALWGFSNVFLEFKSFLTNYLTLIVTLIGGMVTHEFLHGFTWAQFCHGRLRSIKYGIKWQHWHHMPIVWNPFLLAHTGLVA